MVQQQQSKKTQAVHSGSHTLHYRVYATRFLCAAYWRWEVRCA